MKIDRKLNIVIPCETDAGLVYVHSTPIGRDIFEKYYLPLSKTFSAIYQEGLAALSGPNIAALLLRDIAKSTRGNNGSDNAWDGPEGVQNGLLAEVRRITNVVVPIQPNGWTTMPLEDAIKRKIFTEDDIADIEGIITFFIVNSCGHRRRQQMLEEILRGLNLLWGVEVTSLNCTEYQNSLVTLKETDNSGVTAPT